MSSLPTPPEPASFRPSESVEPDVAAVGRIDAVKTVLRVSRRRTHGAALAVVARVSRRGGRAAR